MNLSDVASKAAAEASAAIDAPLTEAELDKVATIIAKAMENTVLEASTQHSSDCVDQLPHDQDLARKHFLDTLGTIPAAVEVLAKHAPGALDGYLAMRRFAHREPPDGDLDTPTRELLFIVLDVVEGHVEAAKAHAEMGIKAGLTVGGISQALVIAMMVSGINTWSQHGHEVVAHAARYASADEC